MSRAMKISRGTKLCPHAVPHSRSRLIPKALVVAVALACGHASAKTSTWTGDNTGPGNLNTWNSSANWDGSSPGSSDTAVINGGKNTPTLQNNATVDVLQYYGRASGGNLNLGGNTLTIQKDYDSLFFGTGSSFNRFGNVNIGSGGQINASTKSGTNTIASSFQQLSVNGGPKTSGNAALVLGAVHVGQSITKNYQIYDNAGAGGVTLRGAVQLTQTNSQLAGTDVTNWMALAGAIPTGVTKSVVFTAATGGAITGQSLTILNNFSNTNQQTLSITGTAYNIAAANTVTTPISLGNVHINGTFGTSALTIKNTAAAGSFTEGLNASIVGTSGATGTGSISNLVGGASNNSSLVVGLSGSTSTAGARNGTVTVNLASNGSGTSGLGITALTGQTVAVTGGVYNLATGSATPTPVTIATQRVGGANLSALTVANTAPVTSGYTERLDASFGTATTPGSVRNNSGAVSLLNAGSTSTAMAVGVDTSSAGAKSGSVLLNYTSNGAGTSGLGNTNIGSQTIQVSGNVYQSAAVSTSPVSFGIVHVGDTASKGVATNTASVVTLNDTLQGTVGVSGAGFSGGGSFSGVTAGSTDMTAKVALNTTVAGSYSGTAALTNLASHNSEMTNLALTSQSVALSGQVNNYARASFSQNSGAGKFSGSGSSYVLDFGNIANGTGMTSANLSTINSGGTASFTDMLTGTFITTGTSPFTFTGLSSIAGLAGGSKQGFQIALSNASAGSFTQLLTLNYGGFNTGYANTALGSINLELHANVLSPVPEPSTWAMLIGGLAVVSLRGRKMKSRESNVGV